MSFRVVFKSPLHATMTAFTFAYEQKLEWLRRTRYAFMDHTAHTNGGANYPYSALKHFFYLAAKHWLHMLQSRGTWRQPLCVHESGTWWQDPARWVRFDCTWWCDGCEVASSPKEFLEIIKGISPLLISWCYFPSIRVYKKAGSHHTLISYCDK